MCLMLAGVEVLSIVDKTKHNTRQESTTILSIVDKVAHNTQQEVAK